MCSEIEFFGQWVNGPLVSSTVFSALSEPFGLKRRCNSIYTLLQSCLFMEEGEFSSQFQLPTSNNHPNAANIGGGKNGRRCLLRLTLLTTTKTRVLMLEKTSCKISWKPWPDRSCNFVIFPSIRHPLHFPHCINWNMWRVNSAAWISLYCIFLFFSKRCQALKKKPSSIFIPIGRGFSSTLEFPAGVLLIRC